MTSVTRESKQPGRRTRMLQVAMQLASDGGYDAVQMRAVAAEAEVALGTLYRYYPSKDVLLISGLSSWAEYSRQRLSDVAIPGDTCADRLAYTLELMARWSDREPLLMSAMMRALTSTDPATLEPKAGVDAAVRGVIQQALADAPGIDVTAVRRIIGHVWFSSMMRWVSGQAPTGSVGSELAFTARLLLNRCSPPPTD